MPSCQVPGNAKFSFHPIDVDTGHNIHQTGVNSNCNNNNHYPCPSPTPGIHLHNNIFTDQFMFENSFEQPFLLFISKVLRTIGETQNFPRKNHLNALIVVYDIGFIDWLCPVGYLNAFSHSFQYDGFKPSNSTNVNCCCCN